LISSVTVVGLMGRHRCAIHLVSNVHPLAVDNRRRAGAAVDNTVKPEIGRAFFRRHAQRGPLPLAQSPGRVRPQTAKLPASGRFRMKQAPRVVRPQ